MKLPHEHKKSQIQYFGCQNISVQGENSDIIMTSTTEKQFKLECMTLLQYNVLVN